TSFNTNQNNNNNQQGSGTFNSMIIDAVTARTKIIEVFQNMVMQINQKMAEMAVHTSVIFNSFGINAQSGANQIINAMATVFTNVSAGMTGLANTWSVVANSMINNAISATNTIMSAFDGLVEQAMDLFNELASNWSATMNSMIANAKSAADGIIKQLNRIPKKITTIHEIKTKEVAAASGFQGIVSSPTRFLAGEAGPEFVSVTPMSHFGGTQEVTTTVHKTSKPTSVSSSNTPIIVNNQVFLDGVELRHVLSRQLAKNQSAFK
ncbi:MAG TPA: hypothetical protein VJ799_13890, partial [Nitrososphaeraceae archaeon]|nr:hypothetical protein [Nitrososphaeraceae archaeon]